MPKRRSFDMTIRQTRQFAQLTHRQRDLWCGLLLTVDDQGRMPGDTAFVRSQVFPYDDLSVAKLEVDLKHLEASGFILRYEAGQDRYLQIICWHQYQADASWLAASMYPAPPGWTDHYRYTGRDKQIISLNWDSRDGTPNSASHPPAGPLPDPLPTPLPIPLPISLPDPLPTPPSSPTGRGLPDLNDNDNEKEKENDKDKEKEKQKEKDNHNPPAHPDASATPPTGITTAAAAFQESDYLRIFKAVTGMPAIPFSLDGPFQRAVDGLLCQHSPAEIIALMTPHFDRWRTTRSPKSGRLYAPTNPGWLEWVLAEPAVPPPEPEPDYAAIAARLDAWEEQQKLHADPSIRSAP